MNRNSKSKMILHSALKRTIPQSEEELSDRRSTSSSDSPADKTNKKAHNQRNTRRTLRKKLSDASESENIRQPLSGSDPEWKVKDNAEDDSGDSDPAWIPEVDNIATSAKQRIVERKLTRKRNNSVEITITEDRPSTERVIQISDKSGPEPSTDPDKLLCYAGLIPITADATLDKGFESGKFIILKTDLKTQISPSIWRIDGKNLLQKYEPIVRNNVVAYRNISTYSSWMATNKGLYVPIDVEFIVQSKSETIVTFDRTKVLLPVQSNILESLNEESTNMVDSFQIYLQTLISQSIDTNFLSEIVTENDTYFLESLDAVENLWILPRRNVLKDTIKFKKSFQELLETHPGLELHCVTSGDKSCDVCNGRNPTRSFEFQPLSYNVETLESMASKSPTKSYRLCLACTDRVVLYHQLFHVRYEFYKICQTKINDFDLRDVPAAITACLEDDEWKSLMHRKVFLMLAEAQQIVCQLSSGPMNA